MGEYVAHHGFINDQDVRRLRFVARVEVTPFDKGNFQSLKIPGLDHMAIGTGILVGQRCPACNLHGVALNVP